ncbi:Uu.00g091710.m01.CDS01 [Anthostomella pinea]|uniref:Uu.00g091710.m01.CDS01 n=1 Tax=Anthostomella pinea TaxID=933095 RepID=A0AAI8VN50_9PEZI|nr:Uu.00g091710.m01.CDS01 [Anthostomella pinea]
MGEFGAKVSDLLDLYSRCSGLLKAFRGTSDSDVDSLSSYARLRSSIRSDRAKVPTSRSALRRILRRLKMALVDILGTAKTQRPIIDYESLMSLSNTSRTDTIKTIERLSHRLSSRRLSSAQKGHETSPPYASRSRRHKKQSSSTKENNRDRHRAGSKDPRLGDATRLRTPSHGELTQDLCLRSNIPGKATREDIRSKRSGNAHVAESSHRISFISTFSDSTKLGEMPRRRSRLVQNSDGGEYTEFPFHPVYPINAYRPESDEKRSFLRRLFGSHGRK